MFKNTLKRLGAIVMVLALAMSVMAVSAFAADATIAKEYKTTTGEAVAVKPAEELTLAISEREAKDYSDTAYATSTNIPDITVTKAAGSDNFSVTLPSYNGIGKFTYTLTETAGNTAGVTYSAETIKVVVLRTWDAETEGGIATEVYVQNAEGTAKVEKITNTFDTGSLTVKKELAGDFSDPNADFTITVTLTAPEGKEVKNTFKVGKEEITADEWKDGSYTVTLTLKGGAEETLSNLPVGVTYKVEETDAVGHDSSIDGATGTITTTGATATVTNTKNASPVTGVIMNIAPYALMLVLAGGIAVFFLRRRNAE